MNWQNEMKVFFEQESRQGRCSPTAPTVAAASEPSHWFSQEILIQLASAETNLISFLYI